MNRPMGVPPEAWEELEREDPAMARVLARLAEVTKGLTCEEKLAAMTRSAIDFAASAGEQIRALTARVAELEEELRTARKQ